MVLLARLVIASIFGVAGVAKLADRAGVRRAVGQFGVPSGLAVPVAWLLVLFEVTVAGGLIFEPSARASGLAAFVLLVGFSVAVAANLVRGRHPDCHCFGRLRSRPIGWSTAARNAVLACIAAFIVAEGRFLLIFAGLGCLALGVWMALALRRHLPLEPGAAAPRFSLPDHEGRTWTLDSLQAHLEPIVLVFSNPGCGACSALLPDVARWQRDFAGRVAVAVVSGGSHEASVVEARTHGLRRLLVDPSRTVSTAFDVAATPSAVVIDGDRRIAAPSAVGAKEITDLIARLTEPMETPVARRTLLKRAAVTAAAGTILPIIAAACGTSRRAAAGAAPAGRPRQLEIDGAWLCNQRYALCTSAECEPSKTDSSIVICHCVVRDGYSIGFHSCDGRAGKGGRLTSTFSTQDVTDSTRSMTCPSGAPWANCLDVTCQVDPNDPTRALCECERVDTGKSVTFGGDCDTQRCNSVIWSAATPDLPGSTQLIAGMKQIGEPITLPQACPT